MTSIATFTYKNQLTIPQQFVNNSSLKGIRKVLVSLRGREIVLSPIKSTVASLSGSLAHLTKGKPRENKHIRQETMKLVAQEIAREGLH